MRKTVSLCLTGLLMISLMAAAGCGKADDAAKRQTAKYPAKPIELIVPYAAGGGTDVVGRALAEALKGVLKQNVVVRNITGGAGADGMNEGLRAEPDGYTLTMVTREVAILPLLGQAPFKTMDFKYISNINVDPELVVVAAGSQYQTIEDLLTALKANPGKLRYASASVPNFYAIQFALAADVSFVTLPFQGAAPAITELLGGRADFGIYNPGEVKTLIQAGKLRPLAIMAERRFAGLDDTPTLKEKGLNVICATYRGIAVPPDTPNTVIKVLEDALLKAVKDPKFVNFMDKSTLGIGYMGPSEFKAMVEADTKALAPVVEIAKKQPRQ